MLPADEAEQNSWADKLERAIQDAQDRRRQKATVRDNRVGHVLENTRTLADLKLRCVWI